MNIYQRKGVWYIDKYPQVKGPGRRQSLHTSSKEAAKILMRKIEIDFYKSECLGIQEPQKMLFDNLCVEYLAYCEGHNAQGTMRRKKGIIANHLLPVFRGKLLNEITIKDVELYKQRRINEVSKASINRELACLKHMFAMAQRWRYLNDSPLRFVQKLKEPAGKTRYLTEEEQDRLLRFCPSYTRPMVIAALHTGMRKGEILGLKWQNVDLKIRLLTIKNEKNNETRRIPINNTLLITLQEIGPQLSDQYVFSHSDGRPYREIYGGFKRAAKDAGLGDCCFHTLRHTFASTLAIKGIDIRTIQLLLGHKTLAMTMRYSHLNDQALRNAVDKLNRPDYNDNEFGTHLAHS